MSTPVECDHGPAAVPSLNRHPCRDKIPAQPATNSISASALAATQPGTDPRPFPLFALFFLAAVLCGLWSSASCLRWANFGYRTFDLAYYIQAVWQLIHGRFSVTVENVPLLGNHVEPIIVLFAPIFAVVRHPMLFVVIQNAALASMGPIGYRLARQRFGQLPSA